MSKKTELAWREIFSGLLHLPKEICTPELADDDFDEDFRPGLIHGLFVKRDPRLVSTIFEAISARLGSPDFKDQVVALYRSSLEREVRDLRASMTHDEEPNAIRVAILKEKNERISSASWDNFLKCRSDFFEAYWLTQRPSSAGDNYCRDNYLLFSIAELLFNHLSRHDGSRFIVPRDSLLASEYANTKINLFESDAQFNSYGLLTVVDEMEFSEIKPLEPFDRRVGKHLTLDADESTVRELVALKKIGSIGKLSFRPRFNIGLRTGTSLNPAMEALERGALFELSKLNKPEITKLYSTNYDTLWVKASNRDLTFEELVQDFVIEGDYIVTQVVHLEHSNKNGVDFINHIDHEYIYYTVDEYEARQTDPDQKGEARSRIKTFKVDDANIPFTLPDGRWFLYTVLERHFKNTALIQEYFQKVL
ncbi:hypothetical protein VOM14_17930 [Paraburkholderia sp. MPAMCS5]|uniref:hypothetical protein n=1 Tax=Paraburkholderia sp. MPAMCS5 TaxID=3112563 RepID=UPI002E16EF06|nr:hypothetical protein [Paraburkholderia sp. MPAMCS5]